MPADDGRVVAVQPSNANARSLAGLDGTAASGSRGSSRVALASAALDAVAEARVTSQPDDGRDLGLLGR